MSILITLIYFITLINNVLPTGKLIFKTGFEDSVFYDEPASGSPTLKGIDSSTGYDFNDLANGEDSPYDKVWFSYVSKKPYSNWVNTEFITVEGHDGTQSRVIKMEVMEDDPSDSSTSRNELSLSFKPTTKKGFFRYWMYIQDDFMDGFGPSGSCSNWNTFIEWKEPNNPEYTTGGTNNYRQQFTIKMNNDIPYFSFFTEQVQPVRIREVELFNYNFPVPIAEWFLVEVYWVEGVEGRAFLAVNGNMIFNFTGRNIHKDKPLGYTWVSPMKNYKAANCFSGGWTSWNLYDDLEIWDGFPPEHTPDDDDDDDNGVLTTSQKIWISVGIGLTSLILVIIFLVITIFIVVIICTRNKKNKTEKAIISQLEFDEPLNSKIEVDDVYSKDVYGDPIVKSSTVE